MAGGVLQEGVCVRRGGGMRGRRDGHCNGRYASYWNAFLLYYDSVISVGNKVSVSDVRKCKNV